MAMLGLAPPVYTPTTCTHSPNGIVEEDVIGEPMLQHGAKIMLPVEVKLKPNDHPAPYPSFPL